MYLGGSTWAGFTLDVPNVSGAAGYMNILEFDADADITPIVVYLEVSPDGFTTNIAWPTNYGNPSVCVGKTLLITSGQGLFATGSPTTCVMRVNGQDYYDWLNSGFYSCQNGVLSFPPGTILSLKPANIEISAVLMGVLI